ncbi:ABC transporter substrate-binding protein [Pelomonas sp. P7]|uniref:ABC transporter substrate-binding protein n=1 Tax=Pelomonas caseinilytica TaxID=2906763 RepID=A0ABS8XB35_9BURK|nr:ABC transporter substrate-binding protein [Pelomonas sp. P7]MCE4536915.1 ABC transporter substrate-binding protein [Pelomonas sp. P7]
MNFAQEKQGASRFTGFGIVVLIHIVAIYALASGLAKDLVKKVTGPIDVKVIEEKVKPPPPPDKVIPPPPDLKAPPPPFVPPPEFQVTAPAPPAPAIQSTQVAPPAVAEVRPAPPPAPAAPPAAKPAKITAGMVCTKMGKPEMPSVNWSGEALYKAVATVKSGRVTAVEITSLRGGVDRKAQRALVQAIEQTLRDTYECPGDHVFEQEFQFKIE